ncbi:MULTISPECIES: DUF2290 domain-containing protein [unclassified Bradyrhizobium]|uniref:DUF2290 domain-containing protein n=1 Tax=unclassified Bradyrhizobium TaxID=2631580 RepID=UPI001CD30FF5|nr:MULTISPECIES: DUF2290 domain-containing protein [unclassified Bradyrhizobium]MCA1426388.1 DUF2290 domain-containing protein [Bradyrhizobium sp. NBAIM16]MCA1505173.1 DUF2290 domain-containing protein [Bradyrhizobium sp. NBAIM02]
MNKADLVPHIRRCWMYAKALRIDELFSGPTALEASDVFKTLAVNPVASYEELYLTGLRDSQYNILLKDFSFFQFGIGSLDGVRYAYYPNPFLGASRDALSELKEMHEFVAEGIIDMDEFLHRISDIRRPQHPPLVRYEYSKLQYVQATHPCSHMHLGFHGENRWPVRRHLTAHAFALLIFRLFYLDFWGQADTIKSGDKELTLDQVLEAARTECRMLYDDEFSEAEGKRFYFI